MAGLSLRTTLQETVYLRPREPGAFGIERFPVFIEARSNFYGFPVHDEGALKLARHEPGEEHGPLSKQGEASREFVETCREFLRSSLPALADATLVRSRLCVYNNTPDEDFLIGRDRSGMVVCTGFSGHGFKFAPIVGRLCAQVVCGEPTDVDISRFAPARPLPFGR
jgi:glycine/D-amino acid oxidase-like deaminating enzyme